ncbi:hypothetical protein VIBRN418_16311 [Vibrio sp. N418]|uniref:DUF5677 domain-containing protein n=1 Tax=Vibrio sp. (strain N418) TaxID=701176 RepID=UPI00021BDF97|nr:DUF5677 domain-containing protein [Vibrio sp. N418]EGU30867.1 hypothetical protein VIBRN418_16311 [Vibrio sp. N418]
MNKKLPNDPLSLVLCLEAKKCDPEEVRYLNEGEHDPIFHKLYNDFGLGKKHSHISRVSLSRIVCGFYKRDDNEWDFYTDDAVDWGVERTKDAIKGGIRPSLHIYVNRNPKCSFDYVCPDDVHAYNAYKALGINKVPVIIHGEIGELEESAFKIKGFKSGEQIKHYIYGMVCVKPKGLYSIFSSDKFSNEGNMVECVELMEEIVNSVKSEFKGFHYSRLNPKIHYHHVMYSVLVRLGESLRAIKLLLKDGLFLQSAHLLRSIYELVLTFYISWISPHEIARFLQITSIMSESEWTKVYVNSLKEEKLNKQQANDLKKANVFQYKLVAKVKEKAKFSPFGEDYYNEIYSFLSRITHHDFSAVARYQNALEHGDESVYMEDFQQAMLSIIDFLSVFIVVNIRDDIGNSIMKT